VENICGMVTMLIPSDFSSDSVAVGHEAIRALEGEVNVVFAHAFGMPDSDQDLLHSSYRRKHRKYVTPSFLAEIEDLKDIFSYKVRKVAIDSFYANTSMLLQNYLDYYGVSLIVYAAQKGYRKLSEESVDLDTFLQLSSCRTVDISAPEFSGTIVAPPVRIDAGFFS